MRTRELAQTKVENSQYRSRAPSHSLAPPNACGVSQATITLSGMSVLKFVWAPFPIPIQLCQNKFAEATSESSNVSHGDWVIQNPLNPPLAIVCRGRFNVEVFSFFDFQHQKYLGLFNPTGFPPQPNLEHLRVVSADKRLPTYLLTITSTSRGMSSFVSF